MRCGFGITKTELDVLELLFDKDWSTAHDVTTFLDVSLTTVQRSLKSLHEKNLLDRRQQNLDKGGYLFFYRPKDKAFLKEELRKILSGWLSNVESSLNQW
jgi:predicted transcriptional regulator